MRHNRESQYSHFIILCGVLSHPMVLQSQPHIIPVGYSVYFILIYFIKMYFSFCDRLICIVDYY